MDCRCSSQFERCIINTCWEQKRCGRRSANEIVTISYQRGRFHIQRKAQTSSLYGGVCEDGRWNLGDGPVHHENTLPCALVELGQLQGSEEIGLED